MPEFSYSLVKYFPNVLRDEPINVGIILHSATEHYLGFRFDLRRAAQKLTRADKETFKHYGQQLTPIENQEIDWDTASFESFRVARPDFLSSVADVLGNKIRLESPRGLTADDPDSKLEDLFGQFVSAGGTHAPRVTKNTIVRDVRVALNLRGMGDYIKSKPVVSGQHRNYTLPLGIRHSHRTLVDALKLGSGDDANYRVMAATAKLWQDACALPVNRHAELCVVLHYSTNRLPEGERLLSDDNVQILHGAPEIVRRVDFERLRPWEG